MNPLDLPTEILLQIVESPSIPVESLLSLVFTCRRLHFIVQPIYLRRSGFDQETRKMNARMTLDRKDSIWVLQTSLYLPQIDHLVCWLPAGPPQGRVFTDPLKVSQVTCHLQRLANFFRRMINPLVSLTVFIEWGPRTPSPCDCFLAADDQSLRLWVSALEDFLYGVLASGCQSFALHGGSYLLKTYEPVPRRLKVLNRIISAIMPRTNLKGSNGGETQYFHRNRRQGRQRIEAAFSNATGSRLSSLDLSSAILLMPPGLSWTLAALRTLEIKSLTLDFSLRFNFRKEIVLWDRVIPLLAAAAEPNLTSLTLVDPEDIRQFDDVLRCIALFPKLRHLCIVSHDEERLPDPTQALRVEMSLEHLETLRAPLSVVRHLQSCRLTNIQSIHVVWVNTWGTTYLPSTKRVEVEVRELLDTLSTQGVHPRMGVVACGAEIGDGTRPVGDVNALQCVSSLEVELYRLHPGEEVGLAKWVAAFSRAERIELRFVGADEVPTIPRVLREIRSRIPTRDWKEGIVGSGGLPWKTVYC
ncbi:hypothetical protein C8F01DRAFT_1147652 [Mycena amicta]|nr:hypothetical protein C8F01DRAFT_1147652 [Mycena amicta]